MKIEQQLQVVILHIEDNQEAPMYQIESLPMVMMITPKEGLACTQRVLS